MKRDNPLVVEISQIVKDALVDAADSRFPMWLPLPGLIISLATSFYLYLAQGNEVTAGIMSYIIWPGVPILVVVTVITWLGWQLDID